MSIIYITPSFAECFCVFFCFLELLRHEWLIWRLKQKDYNNYFSKLLYVNLFALHNLIVILLFIWEKNWSTRLSRQNLIMHQFLYSASLVSRLYIVTSESLSDTNYLEAIKHQVLSCTCLKPLVGIQLTHAAI